MNRQHLIPIGVQVRANLEADAKTGLIASGATLAESFLINSSPF